MSSTSNATSILLLGMKHSGKSTLGKRLAAHLQVQFADLDDLVEELYDSKRSASCREIFRAHGADFFADLEARAAERLAELSSTRPLVAALGGGTVENSAAMNALKDSGIRVYLKDSLDRLFDRIMRNGLPAFLDPENPSGDFRRLYERRTPLYEAQANLVVDVTGKGVDEAFAQLLDRLAV